ncbi:MAG: hypothetical protein AB1555_09115 [Nitrospirota bacterium]
MLKLWTGAVLCLLLSACSPWRVEYLEDTLREASQDEIVHKFGYPQRLKRLDDGTTIWEYDFVGRGARCARYTLTFDTQRRLHRWDRLPCGGEARTM